MANEVMMWTVSVVWAETLVRLGGIKQNRVCSEGDGTDDGILDRLEAPQ